MSAGVYYIIVCNFCGHEERMPADTATPPLEMAIRANGMCRIGIGYPDGIGYHDGKLLDCCQNCTRAIASWATGHSAIQCREE